MGRWPLQAQAITLAVMFLLLTVPLTSAQSEPTPGEEVRLSSVSLTANQEQNLVLSVAANTSSIVAWDCVSCQIEVETSSPNMTTNIHGSSMLSLVANQTIDVELNISSAVDETVRLLTVHDIRMGELTMRPAPGSSTSQTTVAVCEQVLDCIDPSSGRLSSAVPYSNDTSFIHHGSIESSHDQFLVFNASQGDTLEWQWLTSTSSVAVQMYHQTSTEEQLLEGTSSTLASYSSLGGEGENTAYWVAPNDGRFIARLSTDAAHSMWAAYLLLHQHQSVIPLMNETLVNGAKILGHHGLTAPFEWSETQQLTIFSPLVTTEIAVDQLLDGTWVAGTPTVIERGETMQVYPYPDVSGGRLKITNSPVFSLDLSTRLFADNATFEAPSYRPTDEAIDNSTWPVLNLTETSHGEFTLAVHDTTDTYRLVVDGWAESIHFVQVIVEGDITGLELQLWDIDQNTGEVLATDITRPVGDQLKIGLQVGRGTHYLQLRFQNASEVTGHLWGEHVEERTYMLQPSYSLIDEGEEPWFPPSDDAVYWGNVARWFMGIMFLLPVVYLGIHIKRSKDFATSVADMKQRLAWYVSRLDSGESSAKETRVDMAKALHAVAQLEWNEGLEAWGPKRLEHRTDGLALAVWSVDERLANHEGAWPVVVGVHVLSGTWDLAALRFDAPEGQGFEVVHVEPRFLFQGEEVFLDTVGEGQRTYLVVELDGPAKRVDIELNGRLDGEPFAARVPETLERS